MVLDICLGMMLLVAIIVMVLIRIEDKKTIAAFEHELELCDHILLEYHELIEKIRKTNKKYNFIEQKNRSVKD